MGLRIIFAGTADFAVPCLDALFKSPHQIVAVYTQPDRPAGRGRQLQASVVKTCALTREIPVQQPLSLKSKEERNRMKAFNADVLIVVAYGLLIPQKILDLFPFGCLNVHPSLLPRWRGAAPIQRTILAGDTMTGISIMQMDNGLDTGPVLWQQAYPLDTEINSKELHDLLAVQGAKALLTTLAQCEQGQSKLSPQDDQNATYAAKINKIDAEINWNLPATQIHNCVRGFNPWPVAYTFYQEKILRVWKSEVVSQEQQLIPKPPGTIIHCQFNGIDVITGRGVLRLLSVQLPGGKPINAQDFMNGQRQHLIVGKTQLGEQTGTAC